VDQRSIRDHLLFSIGFAISRRRDLLRRLLKEHVTDNTRHQLAKRSSSISNNPALRSMSRGRRSGSPPAEPHGRAPDKQVSADPRKDYR
jgi:hypothetical protein